MGAFFNKLVDRFSVEAFVILLVYCAIVFLAVVRLDHDATLAIIALAGAPGALAAGAAVKRMSANTAKVEDRVAQLESSVNTGANPDHQ